MESKCLVEECIESIYSCCQPNLYNVKVPDSFCGYSWDLTSTTRSHITSISSNKTTLTRGLVGFIVG